MDPDWKKLRKEAGFESTAEVAELMDCGISTINGLENHGTAGRVFKRRLLALYESRRSASASPVSESETDYGFREIETGNLAKDVELWKRRAKEAERKLEHLRTMLRSALELSSTTPIPGARISSGPPSDAQAAAAQASASAKTDPAE